MSDITTSTAGLFNTTMGNIRGVYNDLSKLQNQLSSNSAVDSYSDLAEMGQVQNIQNLQTRLNNAENFIANNKMLTDRLKAMDQNFTGLIDIASKMRNDLTTKRSSAGAALDIAQVAKANLASIRDNLNAQFEGRYLFAGSKTDTTPIGDIVSNTNYSNGQAIQNYYHGDGTILSQKVNESLDLNYGVTGDNDVFKNLIAAMHVAIEGNNEKDDNKIKLSYDMINEGLDGLNSLRSSAANNLKIADDANSDFTDSKIYLNQVISEVMVTNIPEVSLKLNTNMAILQGAYSAFAKLTRLNLVDYLR